jgi:hypothetical protein
VIGTRIGTSGEWIVTTAQRIGRDSAVAPIRVWDVSLELVTAGLRSRSSLHHGLVMFLLSSET